MAWDDELWIITRINRSGNCIETKMTLTVTANQRASLQQNSGVRSGVARRSKGFPTLSFKMEIWPSFISMSSSRTSILFLNALTSEFSSMLLSVCRFTSSHNISLSSDTFGNIPLSMANSFLQSCRSSWSWLTVSSFFIIWRARKINNINRILWHGIIALKTKTCRGNFVLLWQK